MNQAQRDEMLITMSENIAVVKDRSERHSEQIGTIFEKIEKVSELPVKNAVGIKWICIIGSALFAGLLAVLPLIISWLRP